MPFDYKKEYREFYMPKNRPGLVEVPAMNRGQRVQAVDRTAVRDRFYDQDEQEG